jgi:hypothetical protein
MSSLTEKRKREIESLYLKMKQETYKKVMLYVICNIQSEHIMSDILKSINKLNDIESSSVPYGTNTITVIADWKEFEVPQKIKYILGIPNVLDVKAYILDPIS